MFRILITFFISLFLLSASAEATVYYVRTDGNNANAGTTNTSGSAWRTIAKGCSTASAGDTVRIQAGTYVEVASGCTSGSNGNTTTTLVADGLVTTCGMSFSSKSYIRIIGFTIDPSTGGCSAGVGVSGAGTNTGLEFWNVTIQNSNSKAYNFDGGSSVKCVSCIFIGGAITSIGNTSALVAMLVSGNDTFIGYINFSTICYVGIGPSGSRFRMVNNKFSDMVECTVGAHPDFYYIAVDANGYSNGLIESTWGIGSPSIGDNKGFHAQNDSAGAWDDDVVRYNVFYNLGGGAISMYDSTNAIDRWRLYNNDFINCVRAQSGVNGCGNISHQAGHGASASLFNNLVYQGWSDDISTGIDADTATNSGPTLTRDYSLAFSPNGSVAFTAAWTSQVHKQSNVDPKLNNVSSQDFTLQSASGARGTGGPLTIATSCSGTTLNVATNTGSFFIGDNSANLAQYSGKLVSGDFLTVNSVTHQVSSVTGDAVTLADSITCSNGDAVYFGKSSTIDIGVYPYKAGGYSLSATYSINGGTATIVPSDNSLVRFVVCYDSNVPVTVINTAPYTCTPGSGTFLARVYPQYASSILGVDASLSTIIPNRFRYFRKKGD